MKRYLADIVVFLLVAAAVLGQSLAYASMPCATMVHVSDSSTQDNVQHQQMNHDMNHNMMVHHSIDHHSIDHAMMDHSATSPMTDNPVSTGDDNGHCGADCKCPKGTCATAPCIISSMTSYLDTLPEGKIVVNTAVDAFTLASPLFRPPISA